MIAQPGFHVRELKTGGLAVVMALALLAGCASDEEIAAKSIDNGRRLLDAGDIAGALIELKTAVQAAPNDPDARLVLGDAQLASRNAAAALKEFKRARDLGGPSDVVNRRIVRAMLMTAAVDDAATEIALYGDLDQVTWQALQGHVDFAAGRFEEARSVFAEVVAQDPDNVDARRTLARAALALGDAELAKEEITRALEISQKEADVWLIKGQLDLFDQDYDAALGAYLKALELRPGDGAARLGAATVLAEQENYSQALAHLDALGQGAEQDPRVLYLRGMVALKQDRPAAALRYFKQVLQQIPRHRGSLVQAARVHFRQGEYGLAEGYIARILELDPANEAVRRMLAATQLARGNLEVGLGEFGDIDVEKETSPQLLGLMGAAYLKHGLLQESEQSLSRARDLAPDSIPIRTQLILARLSAGKVDEALDEINLVKEQGADPRLVGVLEVLAQIRAGDIIAALTVAESMVTADPESALANNLAGFVQSLAKNETLAASSFERALQLDPTFHPASLNLARLHVSRQEYGAARQILQDVLAQTPNQPAALGGLGELALRDGDRDEAARLWQVAREHNPYAVAPRVLLARHYRQQAKLQQAEELADEVYTLSPYAPAGLFEYAMAKLALGKADQALPAVETLARRFPDSEQALSLLAFTYNQLGDSAAMTDALTKITQVSPDNMSARVALVRLAIQAKDFERAHGLAAVLEERQPPTALAKELHGDVFYAEGKQEAAIAEYLQAYSQNPSARVVLKLDMVENRQGIDNKRLQEWLAAHPEASQVRLALAVKIQHDTDPQQAVVHYEEILEASANPIALNNLAWLYAEKGDQRALGLAERAYSMAPNQPEIVDTYGWILLKEGRAEQALALFRKASAAAPQNRDIRFHLASALATTGEKSAAIADLEGLLENDQAFSSRPQAEALLSELTD